MKKSFAAFLVILTAVLALAVPIYAEDLPLDVSAAEEELPADVREITGSLVTDGSYDVGGAIGRFVDRAKRQAADRLKDEARDVVRIMMIAVICTIAESLCQEGRIREVVSLCACAATAIAVTGSIDSFAGQMIETIRTLGSYAGTVLPVVYTAAAVSGAVVSSGARYAAVLLCLNILMDLLLRLAVPLIYAFLALCLSRSMYPNPVLNTAVSVVKWCTITGMTVLTTVISVYIGFTGSLTAGADAIAVKGGKMVISNALPVVGGILSDAASVVLASASVIKNSAGIYALVGICALCLSPFLAIGVKMLLFRLCATVASAIEGKRLAMLLGDLSTALGMMLGVLGCMTIMLFISLMAAIKTVSP